MRNVHLRQRFAVHPKKSTRCHYALWPELGEKNDDMVVGMIEGILPGVSGDAAERLEGGDDIPPKRVADVFPSHAVVIGNQALCTFLDDNDRRVV